MEDANVEISDCNGTLKSLDAVAGHEVGIPGDETSVARVNRKFDLAGAGMEGEVTRIFQK